MQDLPKNGQPVLIRPLPGKKVAKDGAHGQFIPPGGVVVPWSQHWQVMAGCGAISYQPCPPWGEEVMVPTGKDLQPAKWSPELSEQVLAGKLELPITRAAWEREAKAAETATEAAAPALPQKENG